MRITPDTNVLVRAAVFDDVEQAQRAVKILQEAELVALSMPTLCEFTWVLLRAYKKRAGEVAMAIRRLASCPNVVVSRGALNAGLAVLEAGGDFADGVIAFEGAQLGGKQFVSFDQKAVQLISVALLLETRS